MSLFTQRSKGGSKRFTNVRCALRSPGAFLVDHLNTFLAETLPTPEANKNKYWLQMMVTGLPGITKKHKKTVSSVNMQLPPPQNWLVEICFDQCHTHVMDVMQPSGKNQKSVQKTPPRTMLKSHLKKVPSRLLHLSLATSFPMIYDYGFDISSQLLQRNHRISEPSTGMSCNIMSP